MSGTSAGARKGWETRRTRGKSRTETRRLHDVAMQRNAEVQEYINERGRRGLPYNGTPEYARVRRRAQRAEDAWVIAAKAEQSAHVKQQKRRH